MLAPTDYEITEVEDGEQALAAIAKQRPDLILMDIQLPIMDGYTATSMVARLLRCICPLLAQSGHFENEFQCPLLGVKRTLGGNPGMSAFEPKRTWQRPACPFIGRRTGPEICLFL
jgi:CheY-like chemotaxis protein